MEQSQDNPVSASTRFHQKNQGNEKGLFGNSILNNYQCKSCRKILSSKQNLKEHMYIHTGEKPYVCKEPGCGQTFRQGSQLSAHRRVHTAIRTLSNTSSETIYLKLTSLLLKAEFLSESVNYNYPEPSSMDQPLISLPPIKAPQQ
ncbi:unnamed protein product [Blepharisma stoltei]|uniref:C2H2-type domain-containing protein n=1 Tax=Blepharisma stoltei TaxID=1481888 RepID=A0AAU9JUT7_9CILI|nr:unnamed protein product [Blepharisma stoltei]